MTLGNRNLHVKIIKPSLSSTHYREVDQERYEERDGGLDEEVEVGLGDGRVLPPVHLAGLHQGRVEVEVVGHDDGAYYSDGQEQLLAPAPVAPRHKQALHDGALGMNSIAFPSFCHRKILNM